MTAKSAGKKKKTPSFEEGMQQLEALVHQLSDGELPLEEAIRVYEQGASLAGELKQQLAQHRKRIEMIDPDTAEIEDFEENENDIS